LKSGDVLWLASLHGGVTVDAVWKELYANKSVKSAEKAIAEVRDHFRDIPYHGRRLLYTLNHRGRKLVGLPPKKKVEGERQVIATVTLLKFFAGTKRARYTAYSFSRDFPPLVLPGIRPDYYYRDAVGKISYILIDFNSEPRRLLKRVEKEARRRRSEHWRAAVSLGQFYFTMITGTTPKAGTLGRCFKRKGLPVELVVDPDLFDLLEH
jgi:hypothetical protein